MKEFKIPVSYEMYGFVKVQASSEKEALEKAKMNIDNLPLPDDAEYVDESYKIDDDLEVIRTLNM